MCAVTAIRFIQVNNVLLALVVVLNALTAVSKFQVQSNFNFSPRDYGGISIIKDKLE